MNSELLEYGRTQLAIKLRKLFQIIMEKEVVT